MRLAPIFTAYCLMILLGFSVAKYQGWTLFGATAASAARSGGSRGGGGYSGFHK